VARNRGELARAFRRLDLPCAALHDLPAEALAWALTTPEGRAWLGDRSGARELDVLRWAFAFEHLHGAELSGRSLSAVEAVELVSRGKTLRDLLSEPDPSSGPVRHPLPIRFYDMLVVSDLHLAGGNRPTPEGLDRFSPTEDFFYDDHFFRFLHHHEEERRRRGGYPYELVVNGDMLDFAQVVYPAAAEFDPLDLRLPPGLWDAYCNPQGAGDLPRRLGKVLSDLYGEEWAWRRLQNDICAGGREAVAAWQERISTQRSWGGNRVGGTPRRDALAQLGVICTGHPRFFQGLAWFVARGNRLVLVRGNHDPHLYWPEVQLAFVGWLGEAYATLREGVEGESADLPLPAELLEPLPAASLENFEAGVDFDHGWFYYRDGLAYLEHGGQKEAVGTHRYFLLPAYESEPVNDADGGGAVPRRATDWLPVLEASPVEREIDPHVGLLGIAFFLNQIEVEIPNFEIPEYRKVHLTWMLIHQPWQSVRLLWRAGRETRRAWREWARRRPSREVEERHAAKLEAYARLTGLPSACVRELDETPWVMRWRMRFSGQLFTFVQIVLLALPALFLLLTIALAGSITFLRLGPYPEDRPLVLDTLLSLIQTAAFMALAYWIITLARRAVGLGEDYIYRPSQRVAQILARYRAGVPYLLFGHDHAHNAQPLDLDEEGGRRWYLNTGSWLPFFSKDRKRLVRKDHEFTFVRMTETQRVLASGGRPRVRLLRWNDDAGRVEPCETFAGANERT
jgi:UDP-2,3-diacylglucosamine pyrophosphatase LpxH